MATYRVTDPESGRTLKLTGDSPPTEAELIEIFANTPAKPDTTLSDNIAGAGETALTVASGMAGSAAGGIAGLAQGAGNVVKEAFGGDTSGDMTAADRVSQVQNAMTYQPTTKEGQRNVEWMGEVMEPLEEGKEWMGEGAMEYTGSPEIATAAHMAPDLLLSLLPYAPRGVKNKPKRPLSPDELEAKKGELEAKKGELQTKHDGRTTLDQEYSETGIPVLTSDKIGDGIGGTIVKQIVERTGGAAIKAYQQTKRKKATDKQTAATSPTSSPNPAKDLEKIRKSSFPKENELVPASKYTAKDIVFGPDSEALTQLLGSHKHSRRLGQQMMMDKLARAKDPDVMADIISQHKNNIRVLWPNKSKHQKKGDDILKLGEVLDLTRDAQAAGSTAQALVSAVTSVAGFTATGGMTLLPALLFELPWFKNMVSSVLKSKDKKGIKRIEKKLERLKNEDPQRFAQIDEIARRLTLKEHAAQAAQAAQAASTPTTDSVYEKPFDEWTADDWKNAK